MINVAFSGFIGNCPFYLTKDALQENGFRLTFGADDRVEKFASGKFHIITVTLNALLMNLDLVGNIAKIVYAFIRPIGEGTDRIVCRGIINDPEQLSALKIGVQEKSLEHFLFEYLFYLNKIKTKQNYSFMSRSDYLKAFINKKVDAAVFCEPMLSKTLKEPEAKLYQGEFENVAQTWLGVIAVRKDIFQKEFDKLKKFVEFFLDGVNLVEQMDDEELSRKASSFFEGIISPRKYLYENAKFLDVADNKNIFADDGYDNIHSLFNSGLKFLEETNFVVTKAMNRIELSELFDNSLIEQLGAELNL